MIAAAIATTDTSRAVALVETVGGHAFYHELAKTEIAYKIGADRPDEAIKIIEGIEARPVGPRWQAEAFGWLAVALAPRDRTRAFALIDRALAMMIDNRDWVGRAGRRDGRGRPHRRLCAADRLPRHGERDHAGDGGPAQRRARRVQRPRRLIESITVAAVPLALIDPGAARTVLEQIEAQGGLDPTTPVERPRALADRLGPGRPQEGRGPLRGRAGRARRSQGGRPLERRLLPDGRAPGRPAPPPRGGPGQELPWGILVAGVSALNPS